MSYKLVNKGIDTIVAQATPAGRGGVGVIRVSGPLVPHIMEAIIAKQPAPRHAEYVSFKDVDGIAIDQGLALYFPGPNSFTGEDVLELQGHGGPVVMAALLRRALQLGARMARPGEFSERAFLNDKIDLIQAEAVADLIDSASEQAARSAMRSLEGAFSREIKKLVDAVIELRMFVEAAIDFPEEEIDFLSDGKVASKLQGIIHQCQTVLQSAKQGVILREGMTLVIAGRPNAGKSTLLNALSGEDIAIVTDTPGTTRDIMRAHIVIDGLPLHVIDTAGLRESVDQVEQEGVRRAWQAIEKADRLLLIMDSQYFDEKEFKILRAEVSQQIKRELPLIIVFNKVDLLDATLEMPALSTDDVCIPISAKTGEGLNQLREVIKQSVVYAPNEEGFMARQRHLDALNRADALLLNGKKQLQVHRAGELLAEDLRQAQTALAEITGEFSSDDLLGEIFSGFCVGK